MRRAILLALAWAGTTTASPQGSYPHAGHNATDQDAQLWVRTQDGTVYGMIDAANPNVRQFLGIPYAAPPVGNLRFRPPQPALAYPDGRVDATQMPPSCLQWYRSDLPYVQTQEVLQFNLGGLNQTGHISEDCLTLAVWTPTLNASTTASWLSPSSWLSNILDAIRNRNPLSPATPPPLLPVIVFVFGGGSQTGGIDVPYQNPAQWVQRTKSHVVVTLNFRLNLFGFPNAAGLPARDQNLGLLDQRLALEWVRANIGAFGGDPGRVLLWGQSSGAIQAGYYAYAYADDPIVSALAQDSGTEFLDVTSKDAVHSNFTFVARQVGCGAASSPTDELECMRAADGLAIESVLAANPIPALYFGPVVDNQTVFPNYDALAREGRIAKVPSIVGSNARDGSVFTPLNHDAVTGFTSETLLDVYTLQAFFCSAFKAATSRLALGLSVFRYEYDGVFPNISPAPFLGAYHQAELPLLFGTHPDFRGDSTPLEYATSAAMQDAWLGLVAGGAAAVETMGWPVYGDVATGVLREFGGDGVAAQNVQRRDLESACLAQYQPAA